MTTMQRIRCCCACHDDTLGSTSGGVRNDGSMDSHIAVQLLKVELINTQAHVRTLTNQVSILQNSLTQSNESLVWAANELHRLVEVNMNIHGCLASVQKQLCDIRTQNEDGLLSQHSHDCQRSCNLVGSQVSFMPLGCNDGASHMARCDSFSSLATLSTSGDSCSEVAERSTVEDVQGSQRFGAPDGTGSCSNVLPCQEQQAVKGSVSLPSLWKKQLSTTGDSNGEKVGDSVTSLLIGHANVLIKAIREGKGRKHPTEPWSCSDFEQSQGKKCSYKSPSRTNLHSLASFETVDLDACSGWSTFEIGLGKVEQHMGNNSIDICKEATRFTGNVQPGESENDDANNFSTVCL